MFFPVTGAFSMRVVYLRAVFLEDRTEARGVDLTHRAGRLYRHRSGNARRLTEGTAGRHNANRCLRIVIR